MLMSAEHQSNITFLSGSLSRAIADDLNLLAQIASPKAESPARYLVSHIVKLRHEIAESKVQTAAIRLDIAQEAVDVHAMQRKIIETSIRILEQTIHGSVSRNTKAKADYLATVAEGMSKKLQLQHGQLLTAAYAPEMQEALEARATQLERERLMLQRKTREANERIAEYTQSRQLAELAREYADIRAETAKVRQDLTKLGIS
jgi:hypothetical protein